MPRRSTRQPDPEASEKRVTRRSLQRAAKTNAAPLVQEEEEESGSSRASRSRSSPSPSPAKPRGAARGRSKSGGRGRGRGRGGKGKGKSRSPRGRKTKKKEEWDSEEEEEYIEEDSPAEEAVAVDEEAGGDAEKMEDDDAYVPPKKPREASRGRKSGTPEASPSGRKGRASSGRTPARRSTRGKKDEEEEEEEEAAGDGEEAEEGEAATPGKSRRTRGTPKSKSSPPPRRSSRGATKAASEKLSLLAAQENEEIDDEEKEEEADGAKAEEAVETEKETSTKKRKIDEVEAEDVEEEEAEAKKAKVDEKELKEKKEPDQAEKEEEVMDTEEKVIEKAKSDTSAPAEKSAEESTPEAKKAAEPASEPPCEQMQKESVKEASAEKAEESKPSPTKESLSQDSKPDTVDSDSKQAESTEPMETESAAAEEKPSQAPSQPAAAAAVPAQDTTPSSQTERDAPEKSFVMVQKEDVPAADSAEVKEALPKHKAPEQEASQDKPVAETEKPSQPEVKPTDSPTKPTKAAAPGKPPASSTDSCGSQPADSKPCPNSQQQQCSQSDNVTVTNNHQPPTQGSQKSDPQTPSAPIINNSHGSQSPNDTGNDPLLHRQFCPNPALQGSSPDDSKKFTVVSYNILANCHATHFATEYQFSGDNLSQDKRHQRLMAELRSLDADIICLQEVGTAYFNNVLQEALKGLGYEGAFIKRNSDVFDEGEATFCRSSRFQVLTSQGLVLSNVAATVDLKDSGIEQQASVKSAIDSPAVAMITKLKSVATGDALSVANIHVMFDHFERQDLQCIQVACAIRQLVSKAGGADRPHIICGDFNSWPTSPIYQLTQEGYLNDQSMTVLQGLNKVTLPDGSKTSLVNMWWKGFQHTSSTLKSAYHTVFGKEPPTSRFPTDGIVREVDFIWYSSGSLQLLGTLKTAPEDHIKAGIPNAIYPSDHVSLKAALAFQ